MGKLMSGSRSTRSSNTGAASATRPAAILASATDSQSSDAACPNDRRSHLPPEPRESGPLSGGSSRRLGVRRLNRVLAGCAARSSRTRQTARTVERRRVAPSCRPTLWGSHSKACSTSRATSLALGPRARRCGCAGSPVRRYLRVPILSGFLKSADSFSLNKETFSEAAPSVTISLLFGNTDASPGARATDGTQVRRPGSGAQD